MAKKSDLAWLESQEEQPEGEPITEFATEDGKGPFNCGNCIHMDGDHCDHPIMVKVSERPRNDDGKPLVAELDCCKFVKRPEKKKAKD